MLIAAAPTGSSDAGELSPDAPSAPDADPAKRRAGARPRVLFVASEAFPLAKTGGLADVCGALPVNLAALGVDIRVMVPGYPAALAAALDQRLLADLSGVLGEEARLVAARMPVSDLPVILFDCPRLFSRAGGLYQDEDGHDWPDNHQRFSTFCRAAAEVALGRARLSWRPTVVHAHDWHTGPLMALLRLAAAPRPRTVFTIHNLAFQGNFPLDSFGQVGLPRETLSPEGIEFFGQISFLKAGIRYSDRLTTVSPNYAREILTPEHGCGLDGLLRLRATDLTGILNGVDYDTWDPASDAALPQCYSPEDLSGKTACRSALREELGLRRDTDAPLMIYVNRLTHQKMADVVLEALPRLVANGMQLVVHGEGQREFEDAFTAAARHHPRQVAVRLGYREALAHRMTAAADLSLTASRFEPCGLTTMYAMRYGALPVTRAVGGMADTVQDADFAAGDEPGTGFLFGDPDAQSLVACAERAAARYQRRTIWLPLQRQAMRRDFRWERSAQRYLELYAAAGADASLAEMTA
jgi:starch synthase